MSGGGRDMMYAAVSGNGAESTDKIALSAHSSFTLATEDARPVCAYVNCDASWRKLWKRRARPMFEGAWGCGKACVRGLVEAAVRREMEGAESANGVEEHHQHRMPLGLMLLAQGLVTQAQLRMALEAQRSAGRGRIGDWLMEAAGVDEAKVTRGVGMQWQCPVLSSAGFHAGRMALAMPTALREMCGVAPVRIAGSRLMYLGFAEKVNSAAAFALERVHDMNVESGVLSLREFNAMMDNLRESGGVTCRELDVKNSEEMVAEIADALQKLLPVASRLVRLGDRYWLRLWLERRVLGTSGMMPSTSEDVLDVVLRLQM